MIITGPGVCAALGNLAGGGGTEHHLRRLGPWSLHGPSMPHVLKKNARVEPRDASASVWCSVFVGEQAPSTLTFAYRRLPGVPPPTRPRFSARGVITWGVGGWGGGISLASEK